MLEEKIRFDNNTMEIVICTTCNGLKQIKWSDLSKSPKAVDCHVCEGLGILIKETKMIYHSVNMVALPKCKEM